MSTATAQRSWATGSQRAGADDGVRLLLALLLAAAAFTLTLGASRRNSTTFDEIAMIAGGARGFATGQWDLVDDHPPLMQYLYGLPVYLSKPTYPAEGGWTGQLRYDYGERFFWGVGNDPERLAFRARAVGAATAAALVLLVWAFATAAAGTAAGLLAALLTAFLPDLLAHGGVAYNDLPVAVAIFAAAWTIDTAVVHPSPRSGALAGVLIGVALAIKFSAIVLGPIALLLLIAESRARGRDHDWRTAVLTACILALVFAYLALIVFYRGDWRLEQMRAGVHFKIAQIVSNVGSAPAPAWLLGRRSPDGFALFFPIAFLLKTPLALHLLALLAAAATIARARMRRLRLQPTGEAAHRMLESPLRMAAISCVALLPVLMSSDLNIGFRHALPLMPFLIVLIAAGAATAMRLWGWRARVGVAVLALGYVASSASYYPDFLAYESEYARWGDPSKPPIVDSSLDWGQGLLQLRDFMREENIDRVDLSYFGTAWPAGYGIRYRPLPSFYALPPAAAAQGEGGAAQGEGEASQGEGKGEGEGEALQGEGEGEGEGEGSQGEGEGGGGRWVVISATNLTGIYLDGDPFAQYRGRRPDRVIAHSLMAYRLP